MTGHGEQPPSQTLWAVCRGIFEDLPGVLSALPGTWGKSHILSLWCPPICRITQHICAHTRILFYLLICFLLVANKRIRFLLKYLTFSNWSSTLCTSPMNAKAQMWQGVWMDLPCLQSRCKGCKSLECGLLQEVPNVAGRAGRRKLRGDGIRPIQKDVL